MRANAGRQPQPSAPQRIGFLTGHTRFGPPPMAWFEFAPPRPSAGTGARAGVEAAITALGLRLPPADPSLRDAVVPDVALFERILRSLLATTGHTSGQTRVAPGQSAGSLRLITPCEDISTWRDAAILSGAILDMPPGDQAADALIESVRAFCARAEQRVLDPDARVMMQAAGERDLPVLRLDQEPFEQAPPERVIQSGLYQIGYGARRLVLAGSVPRGLDPDCLGLTLDRSRLIDLLTRHGFPVPQQCTDPRGFGNAVRAVRAALDLGVPVMVRPSHKPAFSDRQVLIQDYGPLTRPDHILLACQAVLTEGSPIRIEGCSPGASYRLLIIGGRLRAALCCQPPQITGTGRATVSELIEQHRDQAGPGIERRAWRELAAGDADVRRRLTLAGLERDSVLERGRTVRLRARASRFNGGRVMPVTTRLSPAILELAEAVAAACGLADIAGIDLAIRDPAGRADSGNCQVTDVVADPELCARPDLARAWLKQLIPTPWSGRIPAVAVTGTNGKTTTTRMLAHIFRTAGYRTGLATTEGAFVDDDCLADDDVAGVSGVGLILADDRVEAAVLETARGGLHKVGLGIDRCDASACLNIADDHIGVDGIDSLEAMARAKSRLFSHTSGHAVINADDPLCLSMSDAARHCQIVLVSRNIDQPALARHLDAGGRAVAHDAGWIVLIHGPERQTLMRSAAIPATMNGLLDCNISNALFAVALAWCMEIDLPVIRRALAGFANTPAGNPGRFNFIDGYPFTVLSDFAQNPPGVAEVLRVAEGLSPAGRWHLACLTIGARHRHHIDELAGPLARRFDRIALGVSAYVDDNPEYAGPDRRSEMLAYFQQALHKAGADPERVSVHLDRRAAIRCALAAASPDDLVVVLAPPELSLPCLQPAEAPDPGH